MDELIIIGGGPMGLYAAFSAGLRDISGRIIESSYTYGGQVSALYAEKKIYDIPGFELLTGQQFIDKLFLQYKRYEDLFPIELNTEVLEIIKETDHFTVNTTQGTRKAKKVLIANGGGKFTPKRLDVSGVFEQENILYTVSNLDRFKNKKIVVLGGGDSAADWALMLAQLGAKVSLVHRRELFRAHQSTINEFEKVGTILAPFIAKEVKGSSLVNQITLTHVKEKTDLTIDVDYILVFYGVDNRKTNVNSWGIETNTKGIIVNSKMETTMPGIYAVGNSVSYDGKVDMLVTGLGETGTAVSEITNKLFPDRKTNGLYSSILIKE